jgi:cytochrome bd-type quinol oxidase subunit 2
MPDSPQFGYSSLWSLVCVLLALVVLFVAGAWGSARRGEEERRDWAIEVFLGGICAAAMIVIDFTLLLYGAFEASDYPAVAPARGTYVPLLLVLSEGLFAVCAVMAGAILVAWASRSRPAWGPRVPLALVGGGGVALCFTLGVTPPERMPSVRYLVDRIGLDRMLAEGSWTGWAGDLRGFLAQPPWGWHGRVDLVLALLLPAVVALSAWAARRAHRRRETCDAGERGNLRGTVTALGLLLFLLSVMRLAFLAEERLACLAVFREFLRTTNTELFLDWLRVAWFPILAAGAGAWVSWFGWSRFRPAPATEVAPLPAGG